MPRQPARAVLAVLLTPALLLSAGCSRDVAVTAPTPPPAAVPVCDALAARLPDTLAGEARRTVTTATTTTAAWGDPPIVLRCGVPEPSALRPTSLLTTVGGVDWFAEELTQGVLFTVTGRTAYVEVAIPDVYEPAAVLSGLASAVRGSDPAATR